MKLGVMTPMNAIDLEEEFRKLKLMGFDTCQLVSWEPNSFTDKNAEKVRALVKEYAIEVSAFWCGWGGPCVWDMIDGPSTIGLVPAAYRKERIAVLKKCSDFVKKIGITDIITHVGFIPVNPADPEYVGLVGVLTDLACHLRNNGQYFLFETGQEVPVTLLRTIEDIGCENIGINLDPANLLLYGMGNPIDALDVFGKYVRNIHAKDGEYPVNGRFLGEEKQMGQGRVNFPAFIRKLKEIGYERYITIEREISGEQQINDIKNAKIYLERLLSE